MTGRTRFGPNIIDTEQIYDDCVTYAKISTAAKASLAAMDTAILADAKVADKTVVKYASVSLYATGTVVYPICTVPSISTVTKVITVCEASRVGTTGTIIIGDAGNDDGYFTNANIGKTLNDISGEDPATWGAYLWVPGVQTTLAQTTTASNWALSSISLNEGTPNTFLSATQSSTAGDYTVTASPVVTTYGHKREKVYLTDTVINATVVKGDNSAGTMGIYVYYDKLVASA